LKNQIAEEIVALLPRLRGFALALAKSTDEADDLVQSAVERALGRTHLWQPGTKLDSWMFRILKNIWLNQLRKEKHQKAGDLLLNSPDRSVDGVSYMESRLTLEQVRKIYYQLSAEHREILHLVCIEGFTYREVADILDIPMGTVMSRLARARVKLHGRMTETETDTESYVLGSELSGHG
jgi:RNA polymerase sigma-70 factor (ECF subfamily)